MIPASPLRIHGAALQQTKARLPGEPREEGGIHYSELSWGEYQLLCARLRDGKPGWGGGRGGYEGITKITKKNPESRGED